MIVLTPITFPNLGITVDIERIALTVFGRPIYWYGIIIACGIFLGALYACRRADQFGTTADDLTDMLLFAVPIAVICARIYYVAFNWYVDGFDQNPIRALYIWEGGLAIYGGIIGAVLTVIAVSKYKKMPVGVMMDVGGLGLLIGQAVGRWGNFINQEAHGGVTDSFLKMGLVDKAGNVNYYHPTFLYESVWNLIGLAILHRYSKRRKFDGEVFCLYVAWYGLGRAWIEGLRTDSLYIGSTGIRVSQLIAVVSCLAALGVIAYVRLVRKPTSLYVERKAAEKAAQAASVEQSEQTAPVAGENEMTKQQEGEAYDDP